MRRLDRLLLEYAATGAADPADAVRVQSAVQPDGLAVSAQRQVWLGHSQLMGTLN